VNGIPLVPVLALVPSTEEPYNFESNTVWDVKSCYKFNEISKELSAKKNSGRESKESKRQ
jgi:hypothetical protein